MFCANAKPFVKWAGGKGWLIPEFDRITDSIDFTHYIEPFIGGGAIYFHLASQMRCRKYTINDISWRLANCYRMLAGKDHLRLIGMLEQAQKEYDSNEMEANRSEYYMRRERFKDKTPTGSVELAADFIYLNKTCFNGLYRENRNGHFNVPFGAYRNPRIFDKETLFSDHDCLKRSTILNMAYQDVIKNYIVDGEKTLVYLDPPYRPLKGEGSSFNYTRSPFGDCEQEELKRYCDFLDRKGCFFILSNSDPHNSNKDDDFFDDLYKGYNVRRIASKRRINSKGCCRGEINELLITNF